MWCVGEETRLSDKRKGMHKITTEERNKSGHIYKSEVTGKL